MFYYLYFYHSLSLFNLYVYCNVKKRSNRKSYNKIYYISSFFKKKNLKLP